MGHLAKRNTDGKAHLARALAQGLPFADASFDTVIATFPAEYIKDPLTLAEVKHCLSDGGRFIVLPVALQKGRGLLERAMSLLFRVTRQSPVDPLEVVREKLKAPFVEAGFDVEVKELQVKSSLLLVIISSRSRESIGTM
jgi:ubiquinone/menaquinone biosynthesis C-methylase UbiE